MTMLTYDLTERNGLPLYEALYRAIKNDIVQGTLSTGDKLPSKRSLADHLSLSKITVENAYAQLVAEGLVRAVPKSGYYVEALAPLAHTVCAEGEKTAAAHTDSVTYCADYTRSYTLPECFPFSTWARLMRQVVLDRSTALLNETPFNGAIELRTAIADYLHRFRGMRVSPDCILVGAGTEYLYQLLIQLFGREKRYAVEEPGYRKVRSIFRANGVAYSPIPLDESGVCLSALRESGAEILHLSPSHHFPAGIVTPMPRRQALLAWAQEGEGRFIVEDDYDSEFRFRGKPLPTLQSIDSLGRVVYINTLSETMAPSMRISYAVLPENLMARFRRELSFYACTVPAFEQLTLARFISDGCFEKHIARSAKYYRELRDVLLTAIRTSEAASYMDISGGDSGLHFLLRLHTEKTEAEISAQLSAQGIHAYFLSHYYTEPAAHESERVLVINYAGMNRDNVAQIVPALERILLGKG